MPPAPTADETVFPAELWNGEMGEFLRKHGHAPEDPKNILAKQEPVESLLAEGAAELRDTLATLNAVSGCVIAHLHLLQPALWRGRFGPFLLSRLDLSPYRPWNTIFLPADPEGALELGLPIAPKLEDSIPEDVEMMMEMIAETFAGKTSAESNALVMMFAATRNNFPDLFPADPADYSSDVRAARANVRAMAFMHASTKLIDKDVIIQSHDTFLANPEIQLTS